MQKGWIGVQEGTKIKFKIILNEEEIYVEVFTTRCETIMGCEFLALSFDHELVKNIEDPEFL